MTDPVDIPYMERLVVEATLADGKPIQNIRITRTLPLEQQYTLEAATVRDVQGYIENNGIRYELTFDSQRGLYTVPLRATRGEEYKLVAQWNGKQVTARTIVPHPPTVDSIAVDTTESFDPHMRSYSSIDIFFTPNSRQAVHGVEITGDIDGSTYEIIRLGYGEPIFRLRDTNDQGKIHYHFGTKGEHYGGIPGRQGRVFATIYAFDEQFFDFYSSRYRSDDISFSQEETINWNVDGDGIGLFIGRSMTVVTLP